MPRQKAHTQRDCNRRVSRRSTSAPYALYRNVPRPNGGAGKASRTTVQFERDRVLVVDDDPACRVLLDAVFDMYGFDVFTTDTVLGASALIANFQPKVIVLDLLLPYRSGASWLAQLKANPSTSGIPVVILTSMPDVLPSERRMQAAAVVGKPFRTRFLVDVVRAACTWPTPATTPIRIDSASIRPLGSL